MDNNSSARDYIDFYNFWAWEYTKRNDEFSKWRSKMASFVDRVCTQNGINGKEERNAIGVLEIAFDQVQDCEIGDEDLEIADEYTKKIYELLDIYGFEPDYKLIDEYNPERIMRALLEGKKLNSVVKRKLDTINLYDFNFNKFDRPGDMFVQLSNGERVEGANAVIGINIDAPINVTLLEIRDAIELLRSARNEKISSSQMDLYPEIDKIRIKNRKSVSFDLKSNVSRAIGLWLWEYTRKNNCGSPTAIDELRKTGYLKALDYDKDDRHLRRLFTRTKACIKAAEVLSMK